MLPASRVFASTGVCDGVRRRPVFDAGDQRRSARNRSFGFGVILNAVRMRSYQVGLLAVVLCLAACSSGSGKHAMATSTTGTSGSTTTNALARGQLQPVVVLDRVENADLYGADLVSDPRSGVWFVISDNESGAVRLDHLDAKGSLRSIPLPAEFANGAGSPDPMLAVDPDGTAWVLGQSALAEVGRTAVMPKLIPLGSWPNTEPHTPRVLASDGAGHVAVAFDDTTVVRVYNARSGTFSDVSLPVGTDAWSLRYFADGSLAIGLTIFHAQPTVALIATPSGSLSRGIRVGDTEVASAYSNTAVLFGAFHPTVLDRDGTTRPVALPAGSKLAPFDGSVRLGRDRKLVVSTGTAITIFSSGADPVATATLKYPTTSCGPFSGGGPLSPTGASGPVSEPTPICRDSPDGVTLDREGNIWLVYRTKIQGSEHLIVKTIDHY